MRACVRATKGAACPRRKGVSSCIRSFSRVGAVTKVPATAATQAGFRPVQAHAQQMARLTRLARVRGLHALPRVGGPGWLVESCHLSRPRLPAENADLSRSDSKKVAEKRVVLRRRSVSRWRRRGAGAQRPHPHLAAQRRHPHLAAQRPHPHDGALARVFQEHWAGVLPGDEARLPRGETTGPGIVMYKFINS